MGVDRGPLQQFATIEFCGQRFAVRESGAVVGRRGDVVIDADNRFIHRRFLFLGVEHGWWILHNVGNGGVATVLTRRWRCEARLGPGASLVLTDSAQTVQFVAGPTRYEFEIHLPVSDRQRLELADGTTGDCTLGRLALTRDQKLLILALAEPALRDGAVAPVAVPTSQHAARRLGWTITKFNRKLDNVCNKFARLGVRGLHGGVDNLATQRRVRLVRHAVESHTVEVSDLAMLDNIALTSAPVSARSNGIRVRLGAP